MNFISSFKKDNGKTIMFNYPLKLKKIAKFGRKFEDDIYTFEYNMSERLIPFLPSHNLFVIDAKNRQDIAISAIFFIEKICHKNRKIIKYCIDEMLEFKVILSPAETQLILEAIK